MSSLDSVEIEDALPRILGFFPHPDDEAYAVAATFKKLCLSGVQVRLVCATDGEAGMHRGDASIRGAELGRVRRQELLHSANLMGVHSVEFLGLPDGGLAKLDQHFLVAALQEQMRSFRPHLVVTLGEDGVYGHIDHVTLTHALTQVFTNIEWSKIRLMHCVFPQRLFSPTFKMLKKRAGYMLHQDVRLENLGVRRQDCDVIVPTGELSQVKRACIEAHASQLLDARVDTFLLPGLENHLLQEEWFKWVSGPRFSAPSESLLEGLVC